MSRISKGEGGNGGGSGRMSRICWAVDKDGNKKEVPCVAGATESGDGGGMQMSKIGRAHV